MITTRNDKQEVKIVKKVNDVLVPSKKRHKLIVGGRGKGASWSIARILLLQGMSNKMFIVCVREVQKTIANSVKKLLEDQIKLFGWDDVFYKIQENRIIGRNGTVFVFHGLRDYNADNIKSLEGADACWVAEAQTISRRSINILRPTIRKEGSTVWWDFNPRYETDPIYIDYIINEDPHCEVLWLSHSDNPWFTSALQMEMESDYSRDEVEAAHIWEGTLRFAGEKHVCPSAFVIAAMHRPIPTKLKFPIIVGADIAHQGGDEIVFYKRAGYAIIDSYFSRYQNTIKTYKDLKAFATDSSVVINIDNGDIGKAVADLIEEDGFFCNRINFGGVPKDPEHYEDCVTEMYFELRDNMDELSIPYDEECLKQISERKYDYINGRRGYEVVKIENKKDFAEHSTCKSNSPDRADALVLCNYEPEDSSGSSFGTLNYNYES